MGREDRTLGRDQDGLFAGGANIAQLWLFWLAPILGAAIAGVISRWQHDVPDASN